MCFSNQVHPIAKPRHEYTAAAHHNDIRVTQYGSASSAHINNISRTYAVASTATCATPRTRKHYIHNIKHNPFHGP